MEEEEKVGLHAVVQGHVQGVGFRYFVADIAVALKLNGWVRNLWSGDVEVMAEGERKSLDQLLTALRRGPRGSTVKGVTFEWREYIGEHKSFYIKSTF